MVDKYIRKPTKADVKCQKNEISSLIYYVTVVKYTKACFAGHVSLEHSVINEW
ncbi:hypothetical protein DFQ00_1386 [Paenibacillus barcinonensis]|uniref:Uncharacterized protein n=1 Tax=Paenibacillus barcinonensis TaxID=198119 RepID=A0A2V4VJ29_PAEBA|nr:hypothetical protein DFQ00_1386 [Paenibacillus barcinonensis]